MKRKIDIVSFDSYTKSIAIVNGVFDVFFAPNTSQVYNRWRFAKKWQRLILSVYN